MIRVPRRAITEHERFFLKKVTTFKDSPLYGCLKDYEKEILRKLTTTDETSLWARDMMDRIICMPKDYIEGWLAGRNSLGYRECDKRMLAAYYGGFLELQEKYPYFDIHKISSNMLPVYESYNYVVLGRNKKEKAVFVGKLADGEIFPCDAITPAAM